MRTMHTNRRWPVTGAIACITLAAIAAIAVFQWTATPPPAPAAASPAPANASELLVRIPLGFEPDEGSDASFLARGPGQSVRLSPAGASWHLRAPAGNRDGDASTRVHMRLVGANPDARGEGRQPQAGRSHYLRGANPTHWRLDVKRFDKVRYAQIYPGVDLVYYGNQRDLEYDFVVAPGADPARIALAFDGVDAVSVDEAGNLVLATPHGRLFQHKPVVYQTDGAARQHIEGRYTVHDRRIAFEVGDYDRSRELVIDPVITYGTYLGGADSEIGYGVAADAQGNIYVAGATYSDDFPTASAADPNPGGDRNDGFVAKYNANGALVYSTYLSGSQHEQINAIAVDASGRAYVIGETDSPDFPTARPIQSGPTSPGGRAVFVTRLGSTGTLEFSTYLGGGADYGEAIAVDGAGNAYITGGAGYNFPTTPGVLYPTTQWGDDAFVAKIDTNAGTLRYSTYLDGTDTSSFGQGIAVDAGGNAYVTGWVRGHGFPVVGGYPEPDFYNMNVFVAKLAPDAASLMYSGYFGGTGTDWPAAIAIDGAGNAFITGLTQSTDLPVLAAAQPTYAGGTYDAFVAKLSTTGAGLLYSTYLGGSDMEGLEGDMGIAVDAGGNAYVAGTTFSANFPVKGAIQATRVGTQAGFLTMLSPAGAMLASTFLGAEQYSYTKATGVAVDKAGNVYATGTTDGDQLPVPGAADATLNSNYWDAFVIRIGAPPPPPPRVRTDINGDGRDDVVWRHGTSGADAIWLGANSATPRAMNAVKDVAWEIVGIGDFGGDRVADVFWRNRSTGANVVWRSANYATQQATTAITDVNWRVAGVGDVDGDGKADIVWRNGRTGANALWRSASYATRLSLPGVTNLAWKIVGVADFDGDGKADLLWRNGSTGANVYWPAGDATKAVSLTAVTNVAWEVVAVGDFSGDRKDDLLWRDRTNGNSVIWKSGSSASQQAVTAVRNMEWKVVGSGDYNGDAIADILWRNTRTGDNVIWRSANSATQQAVARVVDTAWKVAP